MGVKMIYDGTCQVREHRQRLWGLLLVPLLVLAGATAAAGASTSQVKGKKPHQVVFAPGGYEKVVELLSKGKSYKYYQFSPDTPLKLDIVGPTTLEVLIRILYEVSMKGVQEYSLRIEEEGLLGKRTEVGVHNLKATKSSVATLKGENTVVPSGAETISLEVTRGKHTYHLAFKAAQAKRALIRILIPAKDLKALKKEKNK